MLKHENTEKSFVHDLFLKANFNAWFPISRDATVVAATFVKVLFEKVFLRTYNIGFLMHVIHILFCKRYYWKGSH